MLTRALVQEIINTASVAEVDFTGTKLALKTMFANWHTEYLKYRDEIEMNLYKYKDLDPYATCWAIVPQNVTYLRQALSKLNEYINKIASTGVALEETKFQDQEVFTKAGITYASIYGSITTGSENLMEYTSATGKVYEPTRRYFVYYDGKQEDHPSIGYEQISDNNLIRTETYYDPELEKSTTKILPATQQDLLGGREVEMLVWVRGWHDVQIDDNKDMPIRLLLPEFAYTGDTLQTDCLYAYHQGMWYPAILNGWWTITGTGENRIAHIPIRFEKPVLDADGKETGVYQVFRTDELTMDYDEDIFPETEKGWSINFVTGDMDQVKTMTLFDKHEPPHLFWHKVIWSEWDSAYTLVYDDEPRANVAAWASDGTLYRQKAYSFEVNFVRNYYALADAGRALYTYDPDKDWYHQRIEKAQIANELHCRKLWRGHYGVKGYAWNQDLEDTVEKEKLIQRKWTREAPIVASTFIHYIDDVDDLTILDKLTEKTQYMALYQIGNLWALRHELIRIIHEMLLRVLKKGTHTS